MLWKAFRPAKVAFSYSNLQCRLFPCFLFYPITEHAILNFGLLCWGPVKTRSRFRGNPRKLETAREITCTFLFHNVTAGSVVGMPNQQCAVARRPRPGVNRTRSHLQGLSGPQWAPKPPPGAAQGSRNRPERPRARFPPMFPRPSRKPGFRRDADSIGRAQGFGLPLMGDGRKCNK